MRVIAGKYKGRVLSSFQADHIRPTTDRVKESLFNKWMRDVADAKVLDLFSGTGNLGIEAISRDCSRVDFVEMNLKSIQILKKNLDLLKIESSQFAIHKMDVLQFLKKYNGSAFDLILADPPFTEKMAHEVMVALDANPNCYAAHTLIAIESQKKERMDDTYSRLNRYDFNDYGDKVLSFFKMTL